MFISWVPSLDLAEGQRLAAAAFQTPKAREGSPIPQIVQVLRYFFRPVPGIYLLTIHYTDNV